VNTICTYAQCHYREKCAEGTAMNSDTCEELFESCPHCDTAWDCTSHMRTCRDLQATRALLREAERLLEEVPWCLCGDMPLDRRNKIDAFLDKVKKEAGK
jgi:hypothetical protein